MKKSEEKWCENILKIFLIMSVFISVLILSSGIVSAVNYCNATQIKCQMGPETTTGYYYTCIKNTYGQLVWSTKLNPSPCPASAAICDNTKNPNKCVKITCPQCTKSTLDGRDCQPDSSQNGLSCTLPGILPTLSPWKSFWNSILKMFGVKTNDNIITGNVITGNVVSEINGTCQKDGTCLVKCYKDLDCGSGRICNCPKKITVMYLGATYCGPCKIFKPQVIGLVSNYKCSSFFPYDVDTEQGNKYAAYTQPSGSVPQVYVLDTSKYNKTISTDIFKMPGYVLEHTIGGGDDNLAKIKTALDANTKGVCG